MGGMVTAGVGRPRPIRLLRSRIVLTPGRMRPRAGVARPRRRGGTGRNDVLRPDAARCATRPAPIILIRTTIILGRLRRRVQPTGTKSAPVPAGTGSDLP